MPTLDEFMTEQRQKLEAFHLWYLAENEADRKRYPCKREDGFLEDYIIYLDGDVPREEAHERG